MQQTQSPLLRLWQLGRDHHGGLIAAIFCAVAGAVLYHNTELGLCGETEK